MLGVGFNWAQLDVGYRDHWLSPMTDSSTLHQHRGAHDAVGDAVELRTADSARLPVRVLPGPDAADRQGQFVGRQHLLQRRREPRQSAVCSARNCRSSLSPAGRSASTGCCSTAAAAGCPNRRTFCCGISSSRAGSSQTQGNQQASYVSRFIFPGKTPFAVYAQYAGEDNSDGGSYLLGQCGALRRHRLSANLAPLRPDLRDLRVAEHLVRAQHLSGRHDRRRHRAGQLGRATAHLRRRRGRAQPDAAHRLGAAVRRLPAGARAHGGQPELLRRGRAQTIPASPRHTPIIIIASCR